MELRHVSNAFFTFFRGVYIFCCSFTQNIQAKQQEEQKNGVAVKVELWNSTIAVCSGHSKVLGFHEMYMSYTMSITKIVNYLPCQGYFHLTVWAGIAHTA